MSVQPGWYADPAEPTTQRYWDGEGWIGGPLPVDATPPPGPPPEEPEPAPAPDLAAAPTSPAGAGAPTSGGTPATALGTAPGTAPGGGPPVGTFAGQPAGGVPPTGSPANGWPDGTPPTGWVYQQYAQPELAPRPHGLPLAPFGTRLVARLIDIGIVLLLNVVVNGWFVWRFVQDVRPFADEVLRRSMAGNSSTDGLPQTGQADSLQVVILLIAAALWFAYEVPALANGGQTFGKRVMGVKVVPLAADERLGFGRSLRRWNLLGLPTFLWGCCGAGLLLQLVDCAYPLVDRPLRQALHDKRAQTVVVQVPRLTAGTPRTGADSSDDQTDAPTPGGPAS